MVFSRKININDYTKIPGIVIATITLEGDRAIVETDSPTIRKHLSNGIYGSLSTKVTPTDGIAFMKELPYEFSGSILRAEFVEE